MSVASSHSETSNNVHGSVSQKPSATAAVAMTTTPAGAAAASSTAGDKTAAAANWPQVCQQY